MRQWKFHLDRPNFFDIISFFEGVPGGFAEDVDFSPPLTNTKVILMSWRRCKGAECKNRRIQIRQIGGKIANCGFGLNVKRASQGITT